MFFSLPSGAFLFQQTCRYCQGTRQLNPDPCGGCRGKGRKVMPKTVTVQIPAGGGMLFMLLFGLFPIKDMQKLRGGVVCISLIGTGPIIFSIIMLLIVIYL